MRNKECDKATFDFMGIININAPENILVTGEPNTLLPIDTFRLRGINELIVSGCSVVLIIAIGFVPHFGLLQFVSYNNTDTFYLHKYGGF